MLKDRFEQVLNASGSAREFVSNSLRLLEITFRERILLALGDWDHCDISSEVPELSSDFFQAIGSMQRPSWGVWNGIRLVLQKAHKTNFNSGIESLRIRMEQASLLSEVLRQFEQPIGDQMADRCRPLSQLVHIKLTNRSNLGSLFELPISLRNRIAHDSPDESAWWVAAESALRPLVEFMAKNVAEPIVDATTAHSPWIVLEEDDVWTYNGVEKNFSPVYVSRAGKSRFVSARSQNVLLGFQKLLGVRDRQERDLKRLLASLTPEELRGVLLGDFLLGRPMGSGAFATVHYGRQLNTGRRVAIKILKSGLDDEDRARFQKEAEYLASLDHPNIVKVFMHGNQTWIPPRTSMVANEPWYEEFVSGDKIKSYMALEWIDGETLEAVYQREPGNQPTNSQLIDWFAQTSEAVAAVHKRGLIHRDIKPQNIMVSVDGKTKLMDFGIARMDGRRRTIQTEAGHLLGTPEYMSPEQLQVDAAQEKVGPLSDIYSLCATFFELFSKQRLFRHDTIARETLVTLKLTGAKPERLRQLDARLPLEVETLIQGGLETEPRLRPTSAQSLADDLRRVQANLPITYRRPPFLHRAKLYMRRNRRLVQVAGLFTTILCLVIASSVEIWRYQHSQTQVATKSRDKERKRAEEKSQEAAESERKKIAEEYINDMQDIPALFKDAKVALLAERLEKYRNSSGPADPRGFEWYFWSHAIRADQLNLDTEQEACCRVGCSPNGHYVAAVSRSGHLTLWDPQSGEMLWTVPRTAEAFAISPDSKHIIIVHGGDRQSEGLWLFDVESRGPGKHLTNASFITAVAFSPDGKSLVYGDMGADLFVIDSDTGKLKICLTNNRLSRRAAEINPGLLLDKQQGAILEVAFHPNGKVVASAAEDGSIHFWQVNSGRLVQQLMGTNGPISSLSFHPLGTHIASLGLGTHDELRSTENPGALTVYRLADNEVILTLKPQSEFMPFRGSSTLVSNNATNGDFRVSFSRDGKLLVGASNQSIKSWEFPSGTRINEWIGHQGRVLSTALLPDDRIASVGEDATLKIWKGNNSLVGFPLVQSDFGMRGIGITPDGATLAAVVEPGALKEDDANGIVQKRVSFMRFDVCEYDAISGQEQSRLDLESEVPWLNRVQFSLDNKRAGAALVWDRTTQDILLPHLSPLACSLSPDGMSAAICLDDRVVLWDLNSSSEVQSIALAPDGGTHPAFSSNGELLAFALMDGQISVQSLKNSQEFKRLTGHEKRNRTLEFSRDGMFLASGGDDQVVRLWNLHNENSLELRGHNREITSICFSPDGKRLLSTSGDPLVASSVAGELKIWDIDTGRECLNLDGGGGRLFCAAVFHPKHQCVYAACTALPRAFGESSPGALLVWDASGEIGRSVGK